MVCQVQENDDVANNYYVIAVSHTPEEVNFYVIDFGRMFLDFRDLPHIGGIIQEGENENETSIWILKRNHA